MKLSNNFFIILFHLFKSYQTYRIGNDLDAMEYFARFGYAEPEDMDSMKLVDVQETILMFQDMMGLDKSGILDNKTMEVMNMPRCGNKDVEIVHENGVRKKRFALSTNKWQKRSLTWKVVDYSMTSHLSKDTVDLEIKKAFKLWKKALGENNLNFKHKKELPVDIEIKFSMKSHKEDEFPFDGPGMTLAHAFFPNPSDELSGDVHYDDHEEWTAATSKGKNLFYVSVHEIGHSLGLKHSKVQESVMAPTYRGYIPHLKLHKDDIAGIRELYGKRELPMEEEMEEPLMPRIRIENRPNLCTDSSIDAITTMSDGNIYVFKDNYVFQLDPNGGGIKMQHRIEFFFQGLEPNIDAALTRSNGKTYFFKGNQYWRSSKGLKIDAGYPKSITRHFPGIPNNIDAAFTYKFSPNLMYFIKGDKYWGFDTSKSQFVDKTYPLPIDHLGLKGKIDGAFTGPNGYLYFFQKDVYWRLDDIKFRVFIEERGYPKFNRIWWFGCLEDFTPKPEEI